MKKILLLAILILSQCLYASAASDNYTVIVSLDGCRWDYPEMYHTPFFDALGRDGVKAVMMPSFPSKTFPNHYTLATGLYPDHHGIVANSFWDLKRNRRYSLGIDSTRNDISYYKGEPIWVTAQKQGLSTATVYWVGSDIPILNTYPTYFLDYRKNRLNFSQRIQRVVDLLQLPQAKRPRLIMAYFEEPDHNGHTFGPQAPETRQVVQSLDSLLSVMWSRIKALPIGSKVNLIITSDHGMAALSPERFIDITKVLKPAWYRHIEGELPALIYAAPHCSDSIMAALSSLDHIKYWKKSNVPAYLHYGSNPNIGDIVVLPDIGWIIDTKKVTSHGNHGFDPSLSDLQVMFRAAGPSFKHGYVKPDKFRNVDIYVLLAHLLGITPSPTDGNLADVADLLAP